MSQRQSNMQFYALPPGQSCCQIPGGTVLTQATYRPLSGVDESSEGCACKANSAATAASGIEAAVKTHPLLALVGAFLLGCALNSSGSRKSIFS